MKQLVVLSGKGGTGKTSLVASFAALAQRKIFADCDVDAADLHLVVGARIRHRELFRSGKKARILSVKCTECGECERVCRFDAVKKNGVVPACFHIDRISCEGCGVCLQVCPADAIVLEEVVSGEWFVSETRYGPMTHAKLGIAEGNSGKLVSLVRSQARGIALKEGLNLIIIDGPPGIGCPVIASITGTDLVLVVTEPTLSGLHDLRRVHQLANHFKIRTVVCINKFDLNPEMSTTIEDACRADGIEVIGRIPYDRIVTEAQVHFTSVIEYSNGSVSEEIKRIWKRVAQILDADEGQKKLSGPLVQHGE
ncbi:MAG: (4Fe-4S)-binding protein [Candidatus Abyssobacteria bacterium SURF_5]|uniref:(4Fe-4S)-binding protein n=1 Tax=Abyssobacteria bacterium (strain SURF_5) TaxID=2093360 RepID=A0A3A4NTI1_ABYX5|nr:MAG: (4Fe-4S)-binding protein [Candidatus Abyssubacteria bacterium SURF_5]